MRRRLALTGLLPAIALLLGAMQATPPILAQVAGQGSVVINLSFVNLQGQPATPASGNAAGVQFQFQPLTAGLSPVTLVTAAGGQTGLGQAIGPIPTGVYTFQEIPPSGATFQSATLTQTNGQAQALNNGGSVSIAPGASYIITVVNQVASQASGTATVTVSLSLVSASGQATSGNLAGYSFTLTPQAGSGLQTLTQATNQLGQASFGNVAAGVYSLAETPLPGSALSSVTINGLSVPQGSTFVLQAAGTYQVEVVNTASASATGNVSILVQLVDQNGNSVSNGTLAGDSFTLTPQAGTAGTATTVTSGAGGQATTTLPPGSYVITESPLPGSTLVSFTINNVPTSTGVFTTGVGATTSIVVTNRVSSTGTTGTTSGTRTAQLTTGCNNVVNTYPDGSSGQTIATNIVPTTSVDSIWRFDNAAQTFRAVYFAPTGGSVQPPVDIPTLNRLDAIFICVTTPATLAEPGA